jgi:hypothetical protein
MTAINKMFSPEKANKFSKAYDYAKEVINTANSPQEALRKAGITKETINSARNLLNVPLAEWAISLFGGNKENLVNGLNVAESELFNSKSDTDLPSPVSSSSERTPDNELESLQKDLKRLLNK